jgi:cytochrome P450
MIGDVDDDLLSAERTADPYPFFEIMRKEQPVHYSERYGAWFVFRHADVWDALREPRFSSDRVMRVYNEKLTEAQRVERGPTFEILRHWMVFNDPPAHTRLRRLVGHAFSPRAIQAWRPRVEKVVGGLLDQLASGPRSVDLVGAYAYPLPAVVIAEMMGVPPEDRDRFKAWSDDVLTLIFGAAGVADRRVKAQRGLVELAGYLRGLVAQYGSAKGDNLISELVRAREQDDSLTEDEVVSTCVLLLFGGHETTASLIGTGTKNLLAHPDARARLLSSSELLGPAIEELLRFDGPAKAELRWIAGDVELHGHLLRAGQPVYLVGSSANRDELEFEQPDTLRLDRKPNRHLGFGFGQHICLGAPIARLEASVAIDRLLRRFPELSMQGDEEWHPTLLSRGMRRFLVDLGDRR